MRVGLLLFWEFFLANFLRNISLGLTTLVAEILALCAASNSERNGTNISVLFPRVMYLCHVLVVYSLTPQKCPLLFRLPPL